MRQFTAWTEAHLNRMALCTTKRKSQEIALVVLIQWVLRLLASTVWLGAYVKAQHWLCRFPPLWPRRLPVAILIVPRDGLAPKLGILTRGLQSVALWQTIPFSSLPPMPFWGIAA